MQTECWRTALFVPRSSTRSEISAANCRFGSWTLANGQQRDSFRELEKVTSPQLAPVSSLPTAGLALLKWAAGRGFGAGQKGMAGTPPSPLRGPRLENWSRAPLPMRAEFEVLEHGTLGLALISRFIVGTCYCTRTSPEESDPN